MSSAVEELTTGIKIISDNSRQTSQSSSEARNAAISGRQLMQQCSTDINQMSVIIADATQKIEQLNVRSTDIGSVVETISCIAEQTNLLALNAIDLTVDGVNSMIGDIANSTEQQGLASDEISANLAQLARSAEENHSGLSQTATAVHGLHRMAGYMDWLVGAFSRRPVQQRG